MAFLSNVGKLFYAATVFLVLTADNSGVFGYHRGGSKQNGVGGSGTCKYSEFECNDNSGCYTDAEKCDGRKDCTDGSDEDSHHCGTIPYQKFPYP